MAKRVEPGQEGIYAIAERIVDSTLRRDDSLFTPGVPIWSAANLFDLDKRFIQNPDESGDSFMVKFARQLSGAPDPTIQLAAEALYVHFWIAHMSGDAKRAVIEPVLSWMKEPVTIPPDLDEALDHGLASPGPAFHTRRPFQLAYVIEFAKSWKMLTDAYRNELVNDPWAFKSFAYGVTMPLGAYVQREALLHLVHPDTFDSIVSRDHKKRIAEAFGPGGSAADPDVDRRLLAARAELERELGREMDWYEEAVQPRWRTAPAPSTTRAWIFQSDPNSFDVIAALESSSEIWWLVNRYEHEIHVGHRVYLWETGDEAGIVAVARVGTEPARVDASDADRAFWRREGMFEGPKLRVRLDIEQVVEPRLSRETLRANPNLASLPNLKFAQGTNFPLTEDQDRGLLELLTPHPFAAVSDGFADLVQATGWDEGELQELVEAVRGGPRQVVLAGPPGTGKTWIAWHVAAYLTRGDPSRLHMVQFHPSYTYEQFMEGLRPRIGKGGAIEFGRVDGLVLEVVHGMRSRDELHVIVIDEMNRANLSKVFGELMYLFEYRDEPIRLQYSADFELPEKIRFLGTMNTADRSIRALDVALRRRFDVFECPPDRRKLETYFETRSNLVTDLFDGFDALNAALTDQLDRHHTIGHTFFMVDPMTADELRRIWRHQIGPLIDDYFFDRPDLVSDFAPAKFWPSLA